MAFFGFSLFYKCFFFVIISNFIYEKLVCMCVLGFLAIYCFRMFFSYRCIIIINTVGY